VRLLICGEGVTDLGDWSTPQARTRQHSGVIEALLRGTVGDRWSVSAFRAWANARKFQAGDHRRPETRTVLGLLLDAREAECDAVVFVRDRDGYLEREEHVEAGIAEATVLFPNMSVIGGVAIEELEAWLLACKGLTKSESFRQAKEEFARRYPSEDHRQGKVAVVEAADLESLPADALSLRRWRGRALAAFSSSARD
jgi:hypothetical protein